MTLTIRSLALAGAMLAAGAAQAQDIFVGCPPRAKAGMWQVWQANLPVWSLSLATLCGA